MEPINVAKDFGLRYRRLAIIATQTLLIPLAYYVAFLSVTQGALQIKITLDSLPYFTSTNPSTKIFVLPHIKH